MGALGWDQQVETVTNHILRVLTPRGAGTGFLLHQSTSQAYTVIATAAHVVSDAHFWEEPIRLQHGDSGKSAILKADRRAILIDKERDVAAIAFASQDLGLPETALSLIPGDEYVSVGSEIGWLGFPAVADELCFFSGRVSAYLHSREWYLVDGVVINGLSGGPAFNCEENEEVALVGVISAYIPNRATGEALPGLAVVADVLGLHAMMASFKTIEEAQSGQTPPSSAVPDST